MHVKQVKQEISQRESLASIAPSSAKPLPTESESDRKAKLEAQKRDLELLKQRQAEDEKIEKMKIIHEQQKAKKAAERAAAAARLESEAKENQSYKKQKVQQELVNQSMNLNSKAVIGRDNELRQSGYSINRQQSNVLPLGASTSMAQMQFKVVSYQSKQTLARQPSYEMPINM